MELIKITTNEKGTEIVSAKELYNLLEVKTAFKDWMPRMLEYGFEDGKDFSSFLSESTGGRKLKDYAITLDMAKEISMLQRSEKGKMIRKYFIEREKELQQIQAPKQLSREQILAQAFLEIQNMNEELNMSLKQSNEVIMLQAPKVEFYDKVMSSTSTYNTNLIAKELGISAITLNQRLKELGVQYKQGETWVLTAKYQGKDYTKTKTHTFYGTTGEIRTSMQTVWSEKGRKLIHDLLQTN